MMNSQNYRFKLEDYLASQYANLIELARAKQIQHIYSTIKHAQSETYQNLFSQSFLHNTGDTDKCKSINTLAISKEFQFDYGHRVPTQQLRLVSNNCSINDRIPTSRLKDYCSSCVCKHIHGHRGKAIVELTACEHHEGLSNVYSELENIGYFLDFKDLKFVKEFLDNKIDHKTLIWVKDKPVLLEHVLVALASYIDKTEHLEIAIENVFSFAGKFIKAITNLFNQEELTQIFRISDYAERNDLDIHYEIVSNFADVIDRLAQINRVRAILKNSQAPSGIHTKLEQIIKIYGLIDNNYTEYLGIVENEEKGLIKLKFLSNIHRGSNLLQFELILDTPNLRDLIEDFELQLKEVIDRENLPNILDLLAVLGFAQIVSEQDEQFKQSKEFPKWLHKANTEVLTNPLDYLQYVVEIEANRDIFEYLTNVIELIIQLINLTRSTYPYLREILEYLLKQDEIRELLAKDGTFNLQEFEEILNEGFLESLDKIEAELIETYNYLVSLAELIDGYVITSFIPTAENITLFLLFYVDTKLLAEAYENRHLYRVIPRVANITFYETPKSVAVIKNPLLT